MAIITEQLYYAEVVSRVPGWRENLNGGDPWEEPWPPFFRIGGQSGSSLRHDCTEEQAAEIPEIHHDGVFVRILNSSIALLWAELDSYMANDGIYNIYGSILPYWDEASRHWVISFYHRIR